MDYLERLPVEIWREIFSIATSFGHDQTYSSPFLTDEDLAYLDHARGMQDDRFRFLTLCHALYPVAEELLYTQVVIHNQHAYETFMSSAARANPRGHPRGISTKTIHLYRSSFHTLCIAFDLIHSICSNINSFALYTPGPVKELSWNGSTPWTSKIQNLIWSSDKLDWDGLRSLSTQFPRLADLQLRLYGKSRCEGSITFPLVKRLAIDCRCQENLSLENVSMPSLEFLHIGVTRRVEIWTPTKLYGRGLKELRITAFSGYGIRLPLEMFTFCPELEKLTLSMDTIIPPPVPTLSVDSAQEEIHSKISTLHLITFNSLEEHKERVTSSLQRYGHSFSVERFLKLETVEIHLELGSTQEWARSLPTLGSSLFPHATSVTVRNRNAQ